MNENPLELQLVRIGIKNNPGGQTGVAFFMVVMISLSPCLYQNRYHPFQC